jgi:two-component system response regulator YesN
MYNVIIVDDESTIRERLLGFFRKKESKKSDEFKVIGSYENGYDAMIGGIPLEPDLIITDIKMPFITGLELIKQAKQELPLVQAIIVSGYDDFDYAKQAIDLGVVGYISKPVTFQEISDALEKAKVELDKKYSIDKNIKDLQEKSESVLKMVQRDDLNKLVTLKSIPANFREKLQADGIEINLPYVLFAIFDPDQSEDELSFEESELVNYYLDQYINDEFKDFSLNIFESASSKSLLLGSSNPRLIKRNFRPDLPGLLPKSSGPAGFLFRPAFPISARPKRSVPTGSSTATPAGPSNTGPLSEPTSPFSIATLKVPSRMRWGGSMRTNIRTSLTPFFMASGMTRWRSSIN